MVATMVPTIYTREMKYFTHLEYGCTVATVVSIKGKFFNLCFYRRRRIFKKYGYEGSQPKGKLNSLVFVPPEAEIFFTIPKQFILQFF